MDSLNSPTNGIHLPNNRYRNDTQVLRILMKKIIVKFRSHWWINLKTRLEFFSIYENTKNNFRSISTDFVSIKLLNHTLPSERLIWFDYVVDNRVTNLLKNAIHSISESFRATWFLCVGKVRKLNNLTFECLKIVVKIYNLYHIE